MRVAVLSMSLLLAAGMSAHATTTTMAGGPIYGGGTQFYVTCYFFNAGTAAVTVVPKVFDEIGAQAGTVDGDSCQRGPVLANKTCAYQVRNLNTAIGYSCTAKLTSTVAADAKLMRGSMEIRESSNTVVLHNTPLR